MASFPSEAVRMEKGEDAANLLSSFTSPPPRPFTSYGLPLATNTEDQPSTRRKVRWWHYLILAVVVVEGAYLLLRPTFRARSWKPACQRPDHGREQYQHYLQQCYDAVNWTTISDGGLVSYPHHARTSLTLPVSADELYFVSQGALAHGSFVVSQTADAGSTDAVVDIDVSYRNPRMLNMTSVARGAHVCRLHRQEDNSWGVGIFTSDRHAFFEERDVYVQVHLKLPAAAHDWPLAIRKLSTDLPLFNQRLEALSESVYFDMVHLNSTDSWIEAESLAADEVVIGTSNAPIRAELTASRNVTLQTTNAPIDVNATIAVVDYGVDSVMSLLTSNGHVGSRVALVGPSSTSTTLRVSVDTQNAPIDLHVTDAPPSSTLMIVAHTSNHLAHVRLPESFEGFFRIFTTKFIRPFVRWNEAAEDPAGLGRKREVAVNTRGSMASGNVLWGELRSTEQRGFVVVDTSNAPVGLFF